MYMYVYPEFDFQASTSILFLTYYQFSWIYAIYCYFLQLSTNKFYSWFLMMILTCYPVSILAALEMRGSLSAFIIVLNPSFIQYESILLLTYGQFLVFIDMSDCLDSRLTTDIRHLNHGIELIFEFDTNNVCFQSRPVLNLSDGGTPVRLAISLVMSSVT